MNKNLTTTFAALTYYGVRETKKEAKKNRHLYTHTSTPVHTHTFLFLTFIFVFAHPSIHVGLRTRENFLNIIFILIFFFSKLFPKIFFLFFSFITYQFNHVIFRLQQGWDRQIFKPLLGWQVIHWWVCFVNSIRQKKNLEIFHFFKFFFKPSLLWYFEIEKSLGRNETK